MASTLGSFVRNHKFNIPAYTQDLSGANLMNKVSRTTKAWADEAFKVREDAAQVKAKAEGEFAGTQPNVKYRPGTTASGKTFNAALRTSQTNMVIMKSKIGIGELKDVYKNDPVKFQTEADIFISNITRSMNPTDAATTTAAMTLEVQSAGYSIRKQAIATQVDEAKAQNTAMLHTLEVDTNRDSGGLFSPDPAEQGIALNNFAQNKQLYVASLNQVLPDGTPVYTAQQVEKRTQAFHSKFYTNAVQNWVSEAKLSIKDLKKIKDGTLSVDFPGGGSISVLAEIGVDAYDKDVRRYTVTKMRERIAAQVKKRQLEDADMKLNQKKNDISLLNDIYNGVPVASNSIIEGVGTGGLSLATSKSALKMINDPNLIVDDMDIVREIKLKQITGQDVTSLIKSNTYRISTTTYKELINRDVSNQKTLQDEDEKWIVREMVKKNTYGIEDPKTIRLAVDTVDSYRQKIKDGKSPELAFEEIRSTMDVLKDRANRKKFISVPKYSVYSTDGLDIEATGAQTLKAFDTGKISKETYDIEMDRLKAIIKKKQEKDNA